MKKIIEREKDFGKKTTPQYSEEVVCLSHINNNHAQDYSRGRGGRRGRGRRNFRGRGAYILKEKSMIFIAYVAIEMDHMMHPHASCLGRKLSKKEIEPKVKIMTKRKVKHLKLLIMLWHIVILE